MSGSNQVKVICGPGNDVFDLDGISVRGAQRSLVDAFNVPADAPALVNGYSVDPDHRLRAGDIVMTGGLTRAFVVRPQQSVSARFSGIADVTAHFR